MKTVVGAVLEEWRLRAVRALVEVMPQLVMNHTKIFFRDLNTRLDPYVFFRIDVPGARVAHHVPVGRLYEKRPLPKRLWQRRKSQRSKERFAVTHHPLRIRLSLLQNLCQVVTLRRLWRFHQRINVVPFLAPDVPQQMPSNRSASRYIFTPIFLP